MDVVFCISEFTKVLNAGVDCESDLPAILIGIVVAYLTILISVAIAIFSENREFEALDRNVILDHVVKAKSLVGFIGLTFFPLIFWNGAGTWLRLLQLTCWGIGLFWLTNILKSSYRWMKGNKFQQRFEYLKNLTNPQDLEEVWRAVWETENINTQNELEFFVLFRSAIERELKNDKCAPDLASKLLGDFERFVSTRSLTTLVKLSAVFDSVLRWNFIIWQREKMYLSDDDKLDEWSRYNELSRTLDSIITQIGIRALKENSSYSYLKRLSTHLTSTIPDDYKEDIFKAFFRMFFEHVHVSPEKSNIWNHYFPEDWKVTRSNLEGSERILAELSWFNFIDWAAPRIADTVDEKDFPLNDATQNLFPEVEPISWAAILIFIFTPYGEDRLRSVIERPWNFGFLGRVKVYGSFEKAAGREPYKVEEENTYYLANILFGEELSPTNLQYYLGLLEQISYQENSLEDRKRLRLQYVFSKMLESVQS